MQFEDMYLLSDGGQRGALQATPRQLIEDPFSLLRAEALPHEPLVCHRFLGSQPKDIVGMGYAILHLISDRMKGMLEEQAFTGWVTYPVEVYGKNGERIDGYNGLAITGRCGPIDDTRSVRVRRDPPVPGGEAYLAWVGLYFDPSTWDGSDFVLPEGTGFIIVTARVKEAIERAKVSNVRLERLTEVERTAL
jgi:hypothetical protein